MSYPFLEPPAYGRDVTLKDVMEGLRESKRGEGEPVEDLALQLRRSMEEEAREHLPYGELLPAALLRDLVRGLYEYSFETVEVGDEYRLKCTATPRRNTRLRVDPEKLVTIINEKQETVGVIASEGAFTILEMGS